MRIVRWATIIMMTLTLPVWASSIAQNSNTLQHSQHDADVPAKLVKDVRLATQYYWDVNLAVKAGYKEFGGCVSGPQEGAMGIHFVNSDLVGDGEIDVNKPEALIYEQKNGAIRLVGVEYIVLADAWDSTHTMGEVPVLDGQVFQFNGSPNRYRLPAFYELHVWAWRDNPHGAFVDWNTRVSCEGQ